MKLHVRSIHPGMEIPYNGTNVPPGYLLCDGSQVSRTTYAALFAAIGTAHGSGNGTTTFHLPDSRGRVHRGADNMGTGAAGRDPDAATRTAANAGGSTGNNVGSVQADCIQNISGTYDSGANRATSGPYSWSSGGTGFNGTGDAYWQRGTMTFSAANSVRTSTESRMQNASKLMIIKY